MTHSQLHDFAATKGLGEHSPPHFLKREGVSLESSEAERECGPKKKFKKADYISGEASNPHSKPKNKMHDFYKDHGEGNHFEETEDYKPKTSTKKIW